MSRMCPQTGGKVIYLTCQECENKPSCFSKSKTQAIQKLKTKTGAAAASKEKGSTHE